MYNFCMKKLLITILTIIFLSQNAFALSIHDIFSDNQVKQEHSVKRLLNSQIKYANEGNFKKFISTYDADYVNSDGFNLDIYSKLVKEVWDSYSNIKYGLKINNITINGDEAKAEVTETSNADLPLTKKYTGELKSESESIYYLKKVNGKWKVTSDAVVDEVTTMLYGEVKDINVNLTVPDKVKPGEEYCAALEFKPPENSFAIASITADKIEYPQTQSKEVFRALPDDNILERLFTANNDSKDEYIIASIGLTKTDICDLSIKLSLSGFGYIIRRVNIESDGGIENEQTK